MKKLVLLGVAAILTAMMSSCYKQTVCATYTDANETQIESNENL